MPYLNHNIPPFSAYIRNEYLFNHTKGHGDFTFCDIHTTNCMERRAILFECLLPNGVNWTRRPINAFVWKKDAPKHPLNIHMYWDCFSSYISVQRRNRLANCRAELIDWHGTKRKGTYMFTIDFGWEDKAGMLDTNFSEDPEHKCAHMFRMDEGTFFAYPNNRTIWYDDAFMEERLTKNPGYLIDQNFYTVENTREDTITDDSYFTQWEQEKPEQFNVDDDQGHDIGPVHVKSPSDVSEAPDETV